MNRFEEIEEQVRREPDEKPTVHERDEDVVEESELLDPLDEAFLKNPLLIEEGFRAADEMFERWEVEARVPVPERLTPLLRFKALNDTILAAQEVSGEPPLLDPKGFRQFEKLSEKELQAEDDPHLPTIGTEVEIPHSLPVRGNRLKLFEASRKLGIPKEGTSDEEWEFAVPYTYSAEAQNAYLHELIRGGYIETEEVEGGKRIKAGGRGTFSLHLNIEIPSEITQKHPASRENASMDPFHLAVTRLTFAFSSAFSSPERIKGGEYVNPLHWGNLAEWSKPKRDGEEKMGDENKIRRLEIRSLEVRDKTLYRLLHEAQTLSVALFSEFRSKRDGVEDVLAGVWERFHEASDDLARHYGVSPFGLDFGELEKAVKIAKMIEFSDFQKEMRALITSFSQEVETVLDEAKKKREREK